MKYSRILLALFATVTLFASFHGCGKKNGEKNVVDVPASPAPAPAPVPQPAPQPVNDPNDYNFGNVNTDGACVNIQKGVTFKIADDQISTQSGFTAQMYVSDFIIDNEHTDLYTHGVNDPLYPNELNIFIDFDRQSATGLAKLTDQAIKAMDYNPTANSNAGVGHACIMYIEFGNPFPSALWNGKVDTNIKVFFKRVSVGGGQEEVWYLSI